jgi:formamidase
VAAFSVDPAALLAVQSLWDFAGQKCISRHIPGVEFTGITHPGLFGTAPSPELLGR